MVKVERLDEVEQPKRPPIATTPRVPKTKQQFDKQEYTDVYTAVDHFLRTYNNEKRQDKIKLNGVVDRRNKRMILIMEKLKKILNY